MEKKYKKIQKIDSILPDLARSMGIESRIKELMIMDYWSEIAKGSSGKNSKPYNITKTNKGLIFHVAAKSSIVVQELSMIKMFLLDKLNGLAAKIGIHIDDIVVSTKYWDFKEEYKQELAVRCLDLDGDMFDDLELASVDITGEQRLLIEKHLEELNLDNEIKNSLRQIMYKDLKIKKYKELKGFPHCNSCGVLLNNKNDTHCPACRF